MQWSPQLEIEGRTNGFRRGAGADVLFPVYQNSCALGFAQGTGGRWLDHWTGALGAGYRVQRGPFAVGVNGFIDYDYTNSHRSFWQGGIGGELLAPSFEARINGYLPFNSGRAVGEEADLFLRGLDLWRRDFNLVERSYRGVDAEIGYGYACLCGVMWAHAGYYDFTARRNPDIRGPRIRLTYQLDRLFGKIGAFASVGTVWEYDAVHKGNIAAELSVQVPLGRSGGSARCSLTSVRRRMGFPVRRVNSTLVRRQAQPELVSVNQVLTPNGLPQQVVFATGVGAGSGTQSDPTNVAGALAISRPFDFIVPLADGGPLPLTSTFALKDGQQLLGFGDASTLVITADRASLTLFNGAGRPTLTGGGFPTITVNQGNTVQGLATSGGTDGIFGINPVGTTVRNVTITGATDDGIDLTNATGTLLEDVTITTPGDFGIVFGTAALDTTLRRVSVGGTPDDGIIITNGANTLMEDITVSASGDFGIQIAGSAVNTTIRRTTVTGTTNDGILLNDARSTLIEDAVLTTIGDFGIQMTGAARDTTIRRTTITGTANDGILLANANNTLIEDSRLSGIGDFGIQITGSAVDTTIRNTTIDMAANDGIVIADGRNTLIEGTTVSNITGGPGIFISGSSRDLTVVNSTISTVTGDGIVVNNSSDTRISNVSISAVSVAGIFLDNSSSRSVIQNVRIDTTASDGILCENCFDLKVENSTLTNIGNSGGDFGISLTNAREVLLRGNLINTVTDDGINIVGGNNVAILDTTITNAVSRGIDLTNVTGNVRVQGNTIASITGAANFGIECINATTVNDTFYQIANNTISGNGTAGGFTTTDTGISILSTGAARVFASVAGNELRGLDGTGIFAQKGTASATSGLLDVSMVNNRITDLDASPAISVQAIASSDNAVVNYTIAGNVIEGVRGFGMLLRNDATAAGAVAPVIMTGKVNNNTLLRTGGLFAETDMEGNPAHSFTLCLLNNAFVGTTAQAIRVNADSTSFGAVNVTGCGNTDNGSPSGTSAYDFDAEATFTGSYCLTLVGNNSNRTRPTIRIENDAGGGTFEVTDVANLSAVNNDIGVNTSASSAPIIDRNTPCPGCTCNLP